MRRTRTQRSCTAHGKGRGSAVVLVVLGLLAAGCTAAAGAGGDTPAGGSPALAGLLPKVQEDLFLVDRAEGQLVADCMREQGWAYFPVGLEDTDSPDGAFFTVDHHLTRHEAAKRGYGFYVERVRRLSDTPDARAANQDYLDDLSPAERKAWQEDLDGGPGAEASYDDRVGGPTEGCLVEARKQVAGPEWQKMSTLSFELQALAAEATQRARSDEGFTDALDDWQACMHAEGYDVDSPRAAVHQFITTEEGAAAGGRSSHEATERETDMAVADATCRAQSNLTRNWTNARDVHARDVAADNQELLTRWSNLRDAFLPRVRDILGDQAVDHARSG